ncbi:HPr family phosphocarrier protein [Streptomyces sp. NBC_00199]|uniref:HPr family phosphocarrier protein n=1 Tax=Streptomyces sp. NBC_00199 TaxID=2975678 RepID=UPI00225B8A6A|nr:HPr family phosphocarrier protein [Streptomyces sp. NBC_00199]MCX5262582.1 HPr family phosphocarrier protein [Streptomyces sp. NBC_00199]
MAARPPTAPRSRSGTAAAGPTRSGHASDRPPPTDPRPGRGLRVRPGRPLLLIAGADAAIRTGPEGPHIRRTDGNPVSVASTLMLMSLGLQEGEAVILASDDETAGPSLDHLAALLATELDEQ